MAVVGIDLGTTNTVVGAVRDSQASTLADADGRTLLPSVVSFHPNGSTIVGHAARARRAIDPRNTVYSIKRLIGRSWNSEEVGRARQRFPFEMKEGPGQAALVVARGDTFTLPEISAFVLRHAKAVAEKALGEDVDRAVITVPANFNDLQRAATKVAGRVAGLEVLRILNEPTAAALAYGYGKASNERIAIYDFGGGTFDFTLLDLSGNVFEVLATGGNTFLGGDDIDLTIAQRMAEICLEQHRYDPRTDREGFERLRAAAETAKIALSSRSETQVTVPELTHGPGGKPLELSLRLTAAELAALAGPLVERTFEVCEEAMGVARLDRASLDQVVLVGGSTRLDVVRRRVAEFFGRAPLDRVNPDEIVAIGAAIQASALSAGERRRSTIPRPPMPAARATQPGAARRTGAPPLPRGRTDAAAGATGAKRVTTGIGLGTAAPSGAARNRTGPKPPLPRQSPTPALRSGPATLSGTGPEPVGPPTPAPRPPPAARPARTPSANATLGGLGNEPPSEPMFPTDPTSPGPAVPKPTAPKPAAPKPAARKASPVAEPAVPFDEDDDRRAQPPAALPPVDTKAAPSLDAILGGFSPAPPVVQRMAPATPEAQGPALPLLVDVTPLSLCVETVGGYCDVVIERNTSVPCAQSRVFVTAADNQTSVRVRVGQGPSARFEENTELGEVELTELQPAPRGATELVVTFNLDTDGILGVVAKDGSTGREARARLNLLGMPDQDDVDAMAERQRARGM